MNLHSVLCINYTISENILYLFRCMVDIRILPPKQTNAGISNKIFAKNAASNEKLQFYISAKLPPTNFPELKSFCIGFCVVIPYCTLSFEPIRFLIFYPIIVFLCFMANKQKRRMFFFYIW